MVLVADLAFARNWLIKQKTASVLLVQGVVLRTAEAGHAEWSETVGWEWRRWSRGVGLVTGSAPAPEATAAVTRWSEASVFPRAIQTLCRERTDPGMDKILIATAHIALAIKPKMLTKVSHLCFLFLVILQSGWASFFFIIFQQNSSLPYLIVFSFLLWLPNSNVMFCLSLQHFYSNLILMVK